MSQLAQAAKTARADSAKDPRPAAILADLKKEGFRNAYLAGSSWHQPPQAESFGMSYAVHVSTKEKTKLKRAVKKVMKKYGVNEKGGYKLALSEGSKHQLVFSLKSRDAGKWVRKLAPKDELSVIDDEYLEEDEGSQLPLFLVAGVALAATLFLYRRLRR